MALLDKLNQQRQQQQAPQGGQTEAANRLLQAKSGKAGAVAAPVDVEAERAVQQEVQGVQQQAAQQAQMQGVAAAQQSAGIEQQRGQAGEQIALARQALQQNREKVLADMQLKAVQAAERLGLSKQEAAMQARLFEKRLSNEKYIQELQQEAATKRLENDVNFKREIQEQIYGRDLAMLLQSQEYQGALNMSDREFNEWLNQISAKDAYKAAVAAIKQEQTRQTLSAFTGGVAAGSQIGGLMGGSKPTNTTTQPTYTGYTPQTTDTTTRSTGVIPR